MQSQSVVCIVDHCDDCRDVARTFFHKGIWQISARGINYVYAWDKHVFINICKRLNVEIHPAKSNR